MATFQLVVQIKDCQLRILRHELTAHGGSPIQRRAPTTSFSGAMFEPVRLRASR